MAQTLGPECSILNILAQLFFDLNLSCRKSSVRGRCLTAAQPLFLSLVELSALRRVANGGAKDVKADHLEVLLAMGLAALGQNGRVSLTIEGQQRLRAALAVQATR